MKRLIEKSRYVVCIGALVLFVGGLKVPETKRSERTNSKARPKEEKTGAQDSDN